MSINIHSRVERIKSYLHYASPKFGMHSECMDIPKVHNRRLLATGNGMSRKKDLHLTARQALLTNTWQSSSTRHFVKSRPRHQFLCCSKHHTRATNYHRIVNINPPSLQPHIIHRHRHRSHHTYTPPIINIRSLHHANGQQANPPSCSLRALRQTPQTTSSAQPAHASPSPADAANHAEQPNHRITAADSRCTPFLRNHLIHTHLTQNSR
jgi:hypothetical protein